HARVSEIIGQVNIEISNYGHVDQKKKLIAGIVLTGGGAQLKHLRQLTEYITGMDTRVGYPDEHLAGGAPGELTSPIYATAVGLVMKGLDGNRTGQSAGSEDESLRTALDRQQEKTADKRIKSFFENWTEKFKQFLNDSE
ncbi:MAG: cell division protein FtsA, partial [Flavobacteriales bacterium]